MEDLYIFTKKNINNVIIYNATEVASSLSRKDMDKLLVIFIELIPATNMIIV